MKCYTDSGVIVMQKYPFQINAKILKLTAEISELFGSMSTLTEAARSPHLRRNNRIKTIYSSLAIEQNTLSLEQVTAVLSGKRVLAPPKDIAEVQNAFEIYDRLDELDPYSIDDLLAAHSVMVRGLRDDAGEFRSRPVGVVSEPCPRMFRSWLKNCLTGRNTTRIRS